MMESHIAIGIDFGATNSSVGVCTDSQVEIIKNDFGETSTPLQVGFSKDSLLFGQDAVK